MNLVVGATGLLGGEICRRLLRAGKPVRAVVRSTSDPAKKDALAQLGADLIEADLKDRASLDRACRGASTVFSTPTAILSRAEADSFDTVDLDGQMALVDAARVAGVERFVFVSVSQGLGEGGNPLIAAKRAVEKHIQQSGLEYTILRPSFFMEIWLSPHLGFDVEKAQATGYGSGANPISYISLHDVADFAVQSLSHPNARNAVIELGGPEALPPLRVIEIFEKLVGRPFQRQFVSEQELQARKAAATNPFEVTFADLMLASARGDSIDMAETMKTLGFQPRSVEQYARASLRPKSS